MKGGATLANHGSAMKIACIHICRKDVKEKASQDIGRFDLRFSFWPKKKERTKMKCIIAGSRTIDEYETVKQAILDSQFQIEMVISGGARGVDQFGERWAKENGIPVQQFLPDWRKYGKAAGCIRNQTMAEFTGKEGGLVVLIRDQSKGSTHMLNIAKKIGMQIFIVEFDSR